MTLLTELTSWLPPLSFPTFPSLTRTSPSSSSSIPSSPTLNSPAPSHPKLPFPSPSKTPTIILFLRHCGCPFAESSFLQLRSLAAATYSHNPDFKLEANGSHKPQIRFIAISHSSSAATRKWLEAIGCRNEAEALVEAEVEAEVKAKEIPPLISVIIDTDRSIYRTWGLRYVGPWHLFNGGSLREIMRLGRGEGISVRGTESGSRWVRGGRWAVDGEGNVVWGGGDESAEGGGENLGLEVGARVLAGKEE